MSKIIKINEKVSIGGKNPCFIIAEACDNHLGNMDYAKKMVDAAIEAKASAIKFQHHLPDEEMLKDVPMSENFKEPLYEILKKYSLTLKQHEELKRYCDEKGIMYMCTPFSKKAADEIEHLVEIYKIGSGEFTDIPTLIEIAKKNKPMILSTGMCNEQDIYNTLAEILPLNKNIALLNCTSEYPPNYEDINLQFIKKIEETFEVCAGHSDHTPDNFTSYAAVAFGAKIIEKHIILDKDMPGPDANVSINPKELYDLVDGIRKIEKSMTISDKKVFDLEKPIKAWANRSMVSIKDIQEGELLSENNVWSKRPGTGIPAKDFRKIFGKRAKKQLKKDTLLCYDDFE